MQSTALLCFTLILFWFVCGVDGSNATKEQIFKAICHHRFYCMSGDPSTFVYNCAKLCNQTGLTYKDYANLRLLRPAQELEILEKKFMSKYKKGFPPDTMREFTRFRDENFAKGGELEHWTPTDFSSDPKLAVTIKNVNTRAYAMTLITVWPSLGKKVAANVSNQHDQHSLIYVPYGFISAGNDSQEWRYFDSYWVMEGILISKMYVTARNILNNMLYLLEKYEKLPSGSRLYYLDRSHPPLLTRMVYLYINLTGDTPWLRKNIDIISKEVTFWFENRITTVKINQTNYELFQYRVRSRGYRPENLLGDIEMVAPIEGQKAVYLNEIKSASESGWEFSSRWIFNGDSSSGPIGGRLGHPRYSNLSRIIPADLNAFLYGACDDMAKMYKTLGMSRKSSIWREKARNIVKAVQAVHWNETDGTWYDYDLTTKAHRAFYYASNLVPLWTRAYLNSSMESERVRMGVRAVEYLRKEGIPQYEAGIPASKVETGEEWDFPNAWAPSQAMIVQGLRDTGYWEATELAKEFATKWVRTTYIAYKRDKCLYINYDVTKLGAVTYYHKHERPVYDRTGYGWTNGVVLSFLFNFAFPYGTLISAGTVDVPSDFLYLILQTLLIGYILS